MPNIQPNPDHPNPTLKQNRSPSLEKDLNGQIIEAIECSQQVILWESEIEERIYWDHQRPLFSEPGSWEFGALFQDGLRPLEELLGVDGSGGDLGEILNLRDFGIDKFRGQEWGKVEVRTPEIGHLADPVSPCKASLEPIELFKQEKHSGCQCKKSKCLQMYCQCFRSGKQCSSCNCRSCGNNPTSAPQRNKAILKIRQKQPTAFTETSQYKGCRCSKSQCQNGYCECFLNGHTCGKYCRCLNCKNCNSPISIPARKTNKKSK